MSKGNKPLSPEAEPSDLKLEAAIIEFASICNKCEIVPEIYS
jgi:hypothetical protein